MSELRLPVRYFRRTADPSGGHYVESLTDIDLAHAALLAVDVYGPESEILARHVVPALDCARRLGLPVVYVGNSAPRVALEHYEFTVQRDRNAHHHFSTVAAELSVDPREYHHGDGPWGHYAAYVAPRPGDYYVRKIAYSGFVDTYLDSLLRHLGTTTLIAVGFSASECLLGTLIDAFQRNLTIVLLRDCTRAAELLPEELAGGLFTQRMVVWMETYLGVSTTSEAFCAASSDHSVRPSTQSSPNGPIPSGGPCPATSSQ